MCENDVNVYCMLLRYRLHVRSIPTACCDAKRCKHVTSCKHSLVGCLRRKHAAACSLHVDTKMCENDVNVYCMLLRYRLHVRSIPTACCDAKRCKHVTSCKHSLVGCLRRKHAAACWLHVGCMLTACRLHVGCHKKLLKTRLHVVCMLCAFRRLLWLAVCAENMQLHVVCMLAAC